VNPIVEVRDLAHRFGKVRALDGMTFEVAPGELYGLVGPDGAGKTTCLRAVAGVLVADEGTVRVDGRASGKSWGTCPSDTACMGT